LLCTGIGETNGPTVLLQPSDWIDYGSWSVIQARLTDAGYLVCASGYVQGETTPDRQAADLSQGLAEAGIAGPYVLAASVDGVHAARLFAAGRDDIAGMVLVDPMPVGYQDFYDDLLPDFGHPPWLDLAEDVSASLDSFGEVPLVVVEQDPKAVFLSPRFVDSLGEETGDALNQYWQDGLAFYAGLSTDSRSVLAEGTGFDSILWDRPDLVVDEIIAVLEQSPGP
jgi:pimeloyl-ACP methyl ester carboxylesterase